MNDKKYKYILFSVFFFFSYFAIFINILLQGSIGFSGNPGGPGIPGAKVGCLCLSLVAQCCLLQEFFEINSHYL